MTTTNTLSRPSQDATSTRHRVLPFPSTQLEQNRLPLSSLSDEALVSRCQAELPNSVEAYGEIVRRFHPLIFNRSLKMLNSYPDAEEVCQDVLVQIFWKIHQFEGRSTLKTWLFRIVFNMCMTRRRKLAQRNEKQNEFADQGDVLLSADAADVGIDDLCESVQKALSKMNKEKREIVALRFVKGLSIKEIAEKSEMKLSATKMRLYRVLGEFEAAYSEASKKPAA